ncbi:MAG: pseudouridine synthase [Nitrospirae bacterium]|nr:MAG: pseudouridine synthase [Nitrospirota bacterium]
MPVSHPRQSQATPTKKRPPRVVAFHKPYGVLCAFTDRLGRSTLADFIEVPDVYPMGRLDYDSEGLVLLTSDGRLQQQVTHPRSKVWKEYLVQVERVPDPAALRRLRRGVVIRSHRTRPAEVRLLREEPTVWPRPVPIRVRKTVPTAWLRIHLHEGKNRQIRRMTAAVGYPTLRLIRIAIGPIRLDRLQPGQWRVLRSDEIRRLRAACARSIEVDSGHTAS